MWKGLQKPVGRSSAPADRTAAAMEIANLDPSSISHPRNLFLSAVQRPLTGEESRVFVAVAIAQHDLLHRVLAPANLGLQLATAAHKRVLQVFCHDGGGRLEVFDRLK